jgi:cobalt-precorrin 5A hydrolase/precorrin-3B C17-methyltransferase
VRGTSEPRIASVFLSQRGLELAKRLPYPLAIDLYAARFHENNEDGDAQPLPEVKATFPATRTTPGYSAPRISELLAQCWHELDGLILFAPIGVFLRVAKDLIGQKGHDPAVVCVDDAGRFVIAALSAHGPAFRLDHGIGANDLACEVASLLGATPVITTASDTLGIAGLDTIQNFAATGDLAEIGTRLLANEDVTLCNEAGWPLPHPKGIPLHAADCSHVDHVPTPLVVVTERSPAAWRLEPRGRHSKEPKDLQRIRQLRGSRLPVEDDLPVAFLHPPSLVVGIGCASFATPLEIKDVLLATLEDAGLAPQSIWRVATLDKRASHPGIASLPWPVVACSSEELAKVLVPTPSASVLRTVGTPSVAEAAALLVAGAGSELVVPKEIKGQVTIAIAKRRPRGRLSVVGTGPGAPEHRTLAAITALRHAQVLVGYQPYLEAIRDLIKPSQELHPFPIGAETARVATSIEKANAGLEVALVCSGDPGIFAMGSLVVEMLANQVRDGSALPVDLRIIPGVSASLATAAALGAPLGHDHAVVSLSDLLTPWETIQKRLELLARSDVALAIYNPRSSKRTWQLEAARQILLRFRPHDTPVGIVTAASLPDQEVLLTTLGEMVTAHVGMRSCVIVGSTTTKLLTTGMVTPRGYEQ